MKIGVNKEMKMPQKSNVVDRKYCWRKFKRLVKLKAMIWDEKESEWYAITDFAEETTFVNCPFCDRELESGQIRR